MSTTRTPFSTLRYDIFGVAMRLQDALSTAHPEDVYHKALAARLRKDGFQVQVTPPLHVRDASGNIIKTYRPDLRVQRDGIVVLVELKAETGKLQPSHKRQAKAYLSVDKEARAALLINFGRKPLERAVIYRKDL